MTPITFELPTKIVSEANSRGHWSKKYRRAKAQKRLAYFTAYEHARALRSWGGSIRVTLVRLYTGNAKAMDSDNLQSGFKATRDGIAKALGIDDGSSRLIFAYDQVRSAAAGVKVSIERVESNPQERKSDDSHEGKVAAKATKKVRR